VCVAVGEKTAPTPISAYAFFLSVLFSICSGSGFRVCVSVSVARLAPREGVLCDLLWSDPDENVTGWSENERGVSFTFGPDVVSRFLQRHDLHLICRAHQVRPLHLHSPCQSCPFSARAKIVHRSSREGTLTRRGNLGRPRRL
jgi:hypothetical protein